MIHKVKEDESDFLNGFGAFILALGLFIIIGTVGHIQTVEFPNWNHVLIQSIVGLGLMYGGTKLIG
jgi:hydrogenase/urease accessory protein HupE